MGARQPAGGTRTAPDWTRISVLLYGPRKVGKTTVAGQASRPYFFDCEDRLSGIVGDYAYTPTIQQVTAALDWIEGFVVPGADGRPAFVADFPYRTVVWDGLDRVYGAAYEDAGGNRLFKQGTNVALYREKPDKNPATKDPRAAHGVAAEHVARAIHRFHRLPCITIITAHARTYPGEVVVDQHNKEVWEDGQKKRRLYTVPDLAPKVLQLVEDTVDVEAYAYRDVDSGARVFIVDEVNRRDRFISAFDSTGVIGTIPNPRERGSNQPARIPSGPRPLAWASFIEPLRQQHAAVAAAREKSPALETTRDH